jgi:oligopeptide transport system permease protein
MSETEGAIESGAMPMRHYSIWRAARGRFFRNRTAVFGLVIVTILALLAITAPLLKDVGLLRSPLAQDPLHSYAGWSLAHPLGTDYLGRDQLSRVIYGARISLTIGVLVQVIILLIGATIGLSAGYFGGWIDNLLMRFADLMFAFPDLLWVIVVVGILGPSLVSIFAAIGLTYWVGLARLIRGQVLSLKEQEYVLAAVVAGGSSVSVLLRQIIPNIIAAVVIYLTFGIPQAILLEATLSYLGIGLSPPTPSWGVMAQQGYTSIFGYPMQAVVPAVAIGVTLLAFTFLGDGLRDALDVRSLR